MIVYFTTEELPILVWDVSQKLSEKKTYFGYCFSETNISWFEYFLCCYKVKRAFGKFQLEAPRAYKCKQILGLCHSPPRMEISVLAEKKTFCEVKKLSSVHTSVMIMIMKI